MTQNYQKMQKQKFEFSNLELEMSRTPLQKTFINPHMSPYINLKAESLENQPTFQVQCDLAYFALFTFSDYITLKGIENPLYLDEFDDIKDEIQEEKATLKLNFQNQKYFILNGCICKFETLQNSYQIAKPNQKAAVIMEKRVSKQKNSIISQTIFTFGEKVFEVYYQFSVLQTPFQGQKQLQPLCLIQRSHSFQMQDKNFLENTENDVDTCFIKENEIISDHHQNEYESDHSHMQQQAQQQQISNNNNDFGSTTKIQNNNKISLKLIDVEQQQQQQEQFEEESQQTCCTGNGESNNQNIKRQGITKKKAQAQSRTKKGDRKNVVKNFVKAFRQYILDPQNEAEIQNRFQNLQSQDKLLKFREAWMIFEKSSKYNNNLMKNLLNFNEKYTEMFQFFLKSKALVWLQQSGVQDKKTHKEVLEIYIKSIENQNEFENNIICLKSRK